MFGFLSINKPGGMSSRAALNEVAKLIRPHRIGHAGTLDPLATGVLVACIGPATRLTPYVQQLKKTYRACFRLGVTSDTEDMEGNVVAIADAAPIRRQQVTAVLPEFKGTITQLPPKYSALKINGKRAFELARQGKPVNLKPRPVEIHQIELLEFDYPDFRILVECGSGTYIRSLGRDIGLAVQSGAVMTELVRTAIGRFEITDSVDLENLTLEACEANLISPVEALATLPQVRVNQYQARDFLNGVPLQIPEYASQPEVLAIDDDWRLMAVLRKKVDGSHAPTLNFAHYWLQTDDVK